MVPLRRCPHQVEGTELCEPIRPNISHNHPTRVGGEFDEVRRVCVRTDDVGRVHRGGPWMGMVVESHRVPHRLQSSKPHEALSKAARNAALGVA